MLTSDSALNKAPVAQWIEHLPSKQRAAGSSPAGGTIFIPHSMACLVIVITSRTIISLVNRPLPAGAEMVVIQSCIKQ